MTSSTFFVNSEACRISFSIIVHNAPPLKKLAHFLWINHNEYYRLVVLNKFIAVSFIDKERDGCGGIVMLPPAHPSTVI